MVRVYTFVFFCMAWLILGRTDAAEKPTRSECIAGFRLDWSQVKSNRHDVRNSFAHLPLGSQRIVRITALAISQDGSQLYFQFKNNCEKKAEMAAILIEYWRSEGLDLPRFERIGGTITPSTETIDVRGPDWRDNN